jgi:hypothetical protein
MTGAQLLGGLGGLYNIYQGQQLASLGQDLSAKSDPFASQRGMYAAELANLERDPSSITKRPGYQFGLDQGEQALARQNASRGYTGSGNEHLAVQSYGTDYALQFYNQELQRLAGLAGANLSPNPGPAMQGAVSGLQLQGAGLAGAQYALGGANPYGFGQTQSNVPGFQQPAR